MVISLEVAVTLQPGSSKSVPRHSYNIIRFTVSSRYLDGERAARNASQIPYVDGKPVERQFTASFQDF
jgi:hypothetical protein